MKGRPWTTTEERELRLCYGLEQTWVIAARMHRTAEAIRVKVKRLGLRKSATMKDPQALSLHPYSSRSTA